MKKKKKQTVWEPFQKAFILQEQKDMVVKSLFETHPELPPEQIFQTVEREASADVWLNNMYQVARYKVPAQEHWPEMIHLSIKRIDKHPINDWRHMQRIKNELVGVENEGVELYPADSRCLDEANQYHMWVLLILKRGFRLDLLKD